MREHLLRLITFAATGVLLVPSLLHAQATGAITGTLRIPPALSLQALRSQPHGRRRELPNPQ